MTEENKNEMNQEATKVELSEEEMDDLSGGSLRNITPELEAIKENTLKENSTYMPKPVSISKQTSKPVTLDRSMGKIK